jgi:hypothetical protein
MFIFVFNFVPHVKAPICWELRRNFNVCWVMIIVFDDYVKVLWSPLSNSRGMFMSVEHSDCLCQGCVISLLMSESLGAC